MATITQALAKLKKMGEKRDDPLPALDYQAIARVEKKLKCAFPESYRTFLMESREYRLQFEEFLWIGTAKALEDFNVEDIVSVNLEERTEGALPSFLISFLSDGYGNQVCFDTRHRGVGDEHPIVEWERGTEEEHLTEGEPGAIAKDFPAWLIARLKEEQEED